VPKLCLLAFAFALVGCAGSFESARQAGIEGATRASPRDTVRCEALDDRQQLWSGVAAGSALLAGASGVSTLPLPRDSREAQIGLAVGALTAATVAAIAVAVEQSAGASWARECVAP